MRDFKWSTVEKRVARSAYDASLETFLRKTMAEFKAKAAAAAKPSEMWALEGYLRRQRRKIDELFDYRYSQLPWVFARLIGEGNLDEAQLEGLSKDKIEIIRRLSGK